MKTKQKKQSEINTGNNAFVNIKDETSGITLIALIITIIVLLILAGISIATLTGDNGVLNKASDSKIVSALGTAKDEINLKAQEAMSDYYESIYVSNGSSEFNNAGLVNEIMQKLKTNFDGKESNDYIVSAGGISEGATIVVQSKAQPSLRIIGTIQENGIISWTDKFQKSELVESQGLAKDILTLTEIDEEHLDSPYVNYPSAKGTIKCKVLYNDNDDKGLQIVSVDPVTKLRLGKGDPNINVVGEMESVERAQSSYNRINITLNEKAEEYKRTVDGSILAIDARCVGTNPVNKNYPDNLTGEEKQENMFVADSSYTNMNEYNGKFFNKIDGFQEDRARLKKINAEKVNESNPISPFYYLASRDIHHLGKKIYFCGAYIVDNGNMNTIGWWIINEDGIGTSPGGSNVGFRPVFKLSPEVKIIGGEGTEEVPYEIGI